MFKNFLKLLPFFLAAVGAAVFATRSGYTAGAEISNIGFQAEVLEISASSPADFSPQILGEAPFAHRAVNLANTGSIGAKYAISAQLPDDSASNCGNLLIRAGDDSDYQLLGNYRSAIGTIPVGGAVDFDFEIKLAPMADIPQNEVCSFDLEFSAWQVDFASGDQGLTSIKKIPSLVKIQTGVPEVALVYPNGGEYWYIVDDQCPKYNWCRDWCRAHGMNSQCEYEILWRAQTGGQNSNRALEIDLWYSADSGQTWLAKIAEKLNNTGKFNWKIPYDRRFISDKARIKIAAYDKQNPAAWNWDQSDADFCPPLLSIEDLMNQNWALAEPASGGAVQTQESASSTAPAAIAPMSIEEINREISQINASSTAPATIDSMPVAIPAADPLVGQNEAAPDLPQDSDSPALPAETELQIVLPAEVPAESLANPPAEIPAPLPLETQESAAS